MTAPPEASRPAGAHRLLNPVVLGVACGAILVPLNSTMLAVALPSVMAEFGVPASAVAALVTVYLGAVVVTLPLAGTLGDRLGHRRIFLIGVVAFAAASLLAATAAAFWILLAGRVCQAASGALISTSAVALVRAASPESRRGAAFGVFDMLVTSSAAVGPFIGGLIVTAADWRWTFVLALPIAGVAALAVGAWHPRPYHRAEAEPAEHPVDALGLLLLAASLAALLAVLLEGTSVIGLVSAVSLPLLVAALLWVESRAEYPAIDLRLFARPGFAPAVAGVLGMTVILHGTLILVPLAVERLMAGTAIVSGFVLLGISGVSALAAPIGGRISDHVGRRTPTVIGSAIAAVGLAGLWFGVSRGPDAGGSTIMLALLLGVIGLGFGAAGSPRQAAALDAVPAHQVGMAASTYFTGRYLGGVLGASLAGLVLGGAVTTDGVAMGFAILTVVAAAVAAVSLALPDQRPAIVR